MSTISLNFQIHQPCRLTNYDFFKIGEHAYYEDDALNARLLNEISEQCYLPANRLMQQLIELTDGEFRFSLAFSGVFLEQCYQNRPDVIESFKELIDTGAVELLAMPYYASLSSLFSAEDFAQEIKEQQQLCLHLFGKEPKVLFNTALCYSNSIARQASGAGLIGALAEGVDNLMNHSRRTEIRKAPGVANFSTLFRHSGLSDDLAIRRVAPSWNDYPLAPETYADWLTQTGGDLITLSMSYEVLGHTQKEDSGVFTFWKNMILSALHKGNTFVTPSEAIANIPATDECDCPHVITNGTHNSTHNWLSNVLQNEAITKIYHIESIVKECGDPDMLHVWRKLQTADHFYYMLMDAETTSPFASPYDMYISYMNALADLHVRVGRIYELKEASRDEMWA